MQSCTRPISQPETVRGVAGHMHLLGKSIKVEVNAGQARRPHPAGHPRLGLRQPGQQADQAGRASRPGDTVKVTCRHSQELRDRLPSFEGQPDKYVVWGEGTTDEMCLAILLVTRP